MGATMTNVMSVATLPLSMTPLAPILQTKRSQPRPTHNKDQSVVMDSVSMALEKRLATVAWSAIVRAMCFEYQATVHAQTKSFPVVSSVQVQSIFNLALHACRSFIPKNGCAKLIVHRQT